MRILISLLIPFLFVGCNFFNKTSELTIEQKEVIVKSATRTATVIALRESYKNKPEKQNEVANLLVDTIVNDVVPVIGGQSMVVLDFTNLLKDKLSPEYVLAIQTALDVLTVYYPISTDQLFDEHSKRLLVAFLNGVVEGARLVVNTNTGVSL